LIRSEIVLGLPDDEITDLQIRGGEIHISARYTGLRSCPHCGRDRLWTRQSMECRQRLSDLPYLIYYYKFGSPHT